MTADFVTRTKCRLCSGDKLQRVIELKATPPANELCRSEAAALEQDRFPLDLHFCEDCSHLQLLTVVRPERLFSDYVYVSGTSPVFRAHFAAYARRVVDGFAAGPGDLVVEIGSNDGTLLAAFAEEGLRVLGIDPAVNIAREASDRGLPTIPEFFTPRLAEDLVSVHGRAKVVVANNVLAHVDDLDAVVTGVEALLADDGVFVMEVSYLLDVITKVLFDTIYHEHLDYHALGPLLPFFEGHGLQVVDAERVSSHGGSLRVFVQRAASADAPTAQLADLLAEEEAAGLYRAETFRAFNDRIAQLGEQLNTLLRDMLATGKTVAAFGLPAKATTLMHQFDLDKTVIQYVVDDNPLKQGLFSPGVGVPIVDSDYLRAHVPDCIVILAWNFADSICEKLDWFTQGGGKILVPLPSLTVKG